MNEYFVLLIIITIVGFILTISLSIYFIYIPSIRASSKFDDIVRRGTQVLDKGKDVANDVNDTSVILSDFFVALCNGIENNEGLLLEQINDSGTFEETCQFIQTCSG